MSPTKGVDVTTSRWKKYLYRGTMAAIVISSVIGLDYAFKHINHEQNHKITMTNFVLKELDCLTKNIHWESSGEPLAGKIAVAQVTLNRVADGRFGSNVCSVVYQKTAFSQRIVCQFSWVCENKSKVTKIPQDEYAESQDVAKKVMFENLRLSNLNDALYFHADYVRPKWNKERITKIGRHIFYKEPERKNK